MNSFDENNNYNNAGDGDVDDLTRALNSDLQFLEQDSGGAEFSPGFFNETYFSEESSLADDLLLKAKKQFSQEAAAAAAALKISIPIPTAATTPKEEKQDREWISALANSQVMPPESAKPEIPEPVSQNSAANGNLNIPLPTTAASVLQEKIEDADDAPPTDSSDEDEDDGMEIDQGSSAAAPIASIATEILSSDDDDDDDDDSSSSDEEEWPEIMKLSNEKSRPVAKVEEEAGNGIRVAEPPALMSDDEDVSYDEDDGSSSEDDDGGSEDDEFSHLSENEENAYAEKLWKKNKKNGSLAKELDNLSTGPENANCKLMQLPSKKNRAAAKKAKKKIRDEVSQIRLMERRGDINDNDLDDEVKVMTARVTLGKKNADGIRQDELDYSEYTEVDELENLGEAPQRTKDTEFVYSGDGDMQKAVERKHHRIMKDFKKDLDKTIQLILKNCDKEKSRSVLVGFRGVALKLRMDLPMDRPLALRSPPKEKSKRFFFANPVEFMEFKAWLGDLLLERLRKVSVQKATSRNVLRPDHELLECFKELKLTSPGDFIRTERNLFARAITLRLTKKTPLPGTNGEFNNIVIRHPFYKFWEEIIHAIDIKIRKIKIRAGFDTEHCRCAMTGQELAVGQRVFSLTYTCSIKDEDGDDDNEKFETRAMFLVRPAKDTTHGDYPPTDVIAYASFKLLNIQEYAKQRWIDHWLTKCGYVAKTQGIEKCMEAFVSGEQGMVAIQKFYYEYKLAESLLDRYVN